jgi:hypothetical protein
LAKLSKKSDTSLAVRYALGRWEAVKRASRSSQNPDLQKNADGSVDIYFGPNAPNGNDSNWVPTSASGTFEVLFRLYGPKKPLFGKTWKLPDIEMETVAKK